jgi:hypothetical protein
VVKSRKVYVQRACPRFAVSAKSPTTTGPTTGPAISVIHCQVASSFQYLFFK